jgi:hypothetical protein
VIPSRVMMLRGMPSSRNADAGQLLHACASAMHFGSAGKSLALALVLDYLE